MIDPTVFQAKRYGVFSCLHGDSLISAAQRMLNEDISALVVLDDGGYLMGIISRTDLVRAHIEFNRDWVSQTIENHMSRNVVTVSLQTRLSEVARLLLEHQIHRVVVIEEEDGKQRPVGVVSAADLVYHMAKEA